jgi:hypothetical protein
MPKMAEQMSRSGSGRRDHKGLQSSGSSGNDGWSTVGGASQRNKDKVGDLTKFGSVNRSKISGNVSLAPGGMLGSLAPGGAKGWISKNNNEKGEDLKATGLSRANSTSNTYSVLTSENSEGRKSSDSSISENQKPSPPMERKKIVLAPRTKGITPEEPAKSAASKSMSEEMATKKINNMVEEFFSILDNRVRIIIKY